MKIIICTTPIRPVPTDYPPFGPMLIIQSLRKAGYDPDFYHIDALRPSFEEVVRFFEEESPDVVGISAVVSTAYSYTKALTTAIRKVSPKTKIVVGGNLAASAEILLRLCPVDVCVSGEGENIMVELANHWDSSNANGAGKVLENIKGIAFLDQLGEVTFTGYDLAIPAADFVDPDWSILEQHVGIDSYFKDPLERYDFAQDPRTYEPHRKGKKSAPVASAKGCVARCTFCHRWDRGYRHWPVERIINKIKYLMENYNVGFVRFADENFGSDRRKLDELVEQLKPLDILYQVGGVRVASVDLDLLKRMKDSGCVALYYGMETGSEDILQVMEKNSSLEQNVNAARWTHEAGLYTIYQMILGMPGENPATIRETSTFIKSLTEFLPEPPHQRLSLNFIQALPGTPVYEYARSTGLIGSSIEDEERIIAQVLMIDCVDQYFVDEID